MPAARSRLAVVRTGPTPAAARLLLVACALAVAVVAPVGPTPSAEATTPTLSAFTSRLLFLTNVDRGRRGLRPLVAMSGPTSVAAYWSGWQARHLAMVHNPDVGAQLRAAGCAWTSWAENVGYLTGSLNSTASADRLYLAYKASPGHWRNLMHPSMRQIGLGAVARTVNGRTYVYNTLDFTQNCAR